MISKEKTWEVEDATLELKNGAEFYHVDVNATCRADNSIHRMSAVIINGEMKFPHPIPPQTFFEEDGRPIPVELVARNDDAKLDLDGVLLTTHPDSSVEFVASDGELIVFEQDETDSGEVMEILTDLHEAVVDGS